MKRFFATILLLAMLTGCTPSKMVIQPLPPPVVPLVTTPKKPVQPLVKPPQVARGSVRGKVIVVDPGHGAHDPGAWRGTRSKVPEKTIVLDIAKKIGRMLSDRGASVKYSRTTDVFIPLENRALLAERTKTDLFVSIHANASTHNSNASGVDIYIYTSASKQSQRAALAIHAAVQAAGIESRGVKYGNYHVLREHSRPAVLIETGFLTNSGDAARLNTSSYRTQLAAAIVDGIIRHFSR